MPEASISTDGHSAAHYKLEKQIACRKKGLLVTRGQSETTIDLLPDDILLTIFFVYKEYYSYHLSWWISLVHVCRRWRHVIFASPRRLDLTIVCYSETRVKKLLHIWPPFPIAIRYNVCAWGIFGETNVIAALQRHDRVIDIQLTSLTSCELMSCFKMLDRPLQALTGLSLEMIEDGDSVVPDNFLGGYAPSLRTLLLKMIAFPALPKLLLSTTQLVTLRLSSIPRIGYISPGIMATCLAALPNLKQLGLEFHSPDISADADEDIVQSSPPSPTRAVLCSLTSFHFKGISQYLEDLLAQVDTPVLQTLSATFHDSITHIPQLLRFTDCAGRLSPPIRALVEFDYSKVILKFNLLDGFKLAIICNQLQVSSTARVCRALSHLVSRVERLDLQGNRFLLHSVVSCRTWLEFFQPFVAVQTLYVSAGVWPEVVRVLRDLIGDRATEVLPELCILFVERFQKSCYEQESIQSFIAARTLSNHPVVFQQGVLKPIFLS